ncbi:MAG: Single-stranded-DNA-specific exonuclease RecJ [Planctomycetota bacterium]|jgi:single-stranded-DNA-specific exonuclease
MPFPAKRWLLPDREDSRGFARVSIVERLLSARGVRSDEDRAAFFNPVLTTLQHPSAMHGMAEAARAVTEALRAKRRIGIYGDYDVDGVMATAILWHMIRAIEPGTEVVTYVPHRRKEGYGLNADALQKLAADGVQTLVTVDCGVSAIEEARLAQELGLELVVTDHHDLAAGGEIPVARAVVHPRLPSEQRFGELCGAGVAWKLAWMIAAEWTGIGPGGRLPKVLQTKLLNLLPLAAVGTVADVMPLLGENRAIVREGLRLLQQTGIVGFDELLPAARMSPAELNGAAADAEKVAFRLSPRINACGRMGHAEDAVELFTTADRARARELVKLLERLNEQRRADGGLIAEEARRRVLEQWGDRKPRGIVLCDDEWNLGIVGIVCSKLVDEFACPAILITRDVREGSDLYKGSGRSLAGIDLHAVLGRCAEHLAGHGGHAMAAGVQLRRDQIDAFTQAFVREVDALLPPEIEQKPLLPVDCACTLDELDLPTVQEFEQLAPFGRGNPKPTILIEDAVVTQTRVFGRSDTHLELVLKQGARFQRIQWWDGARHAGDIRRDTVVDVVIETKLRTDRLAEIDAKLLDIRLKGVRPR